MIEVSANALVLLEVYQSPTPSMRLRNEFATAGEVGLSLFRLNRRA